MENRNRSNKFKRDLMVSPSMCDGDSLMSIPAAFDLFQDTATMHADTLDIGPAGMNRRRMFWVITKTVMRIERRPEMMDDISCETWIQAADRASCERDFAIRAGDEVLAEGRSIWAVISRETGRLVHMDELYPTGIDFDKPAPEGIEFERIGKKFADAELIGAYTVRSIDIDLGGHMNNVNYVRAMLGCFSSEQIRVMGIKAIEVNYISQTYEGETIEFRVRGTENGPEIGAVNTEGKAVFIAKLYTE